MTKIFSGFGGKNVNAPLVQEDPKTVEVDRILKKMDSVAYDTSEGPFAITETEERETHKK